MTRRGLLTASAGLLASGAGIRVGATPHVNVVLFMTDDHGAWATGERGCMSTPHIDALARDGVRFRNAFAATPVCSPSRMTYMTGRMPSGHGVQDFLLPGDSSDPSSRRFLEGQLTWTELLAKAGYRLGMCGKWHMGRDTEPQAGFTFWSTVPGGGGTYRDPVFVRNGNREKLQGYKTDLVGDSALEFLDTVGSKPFFLMVPFYAPHTPYDYYPDQYGKPYDGSRLSCFPDTPMHPDQNSVLAQHHGKEASKRAYSSLVTGLDANVGRVLKKLNDMGLRDNTLVIFTADQGWNAGHHGVWGKGNGTVPYNMLEESIRVPMIWSQPGRTPTGRTVDAMVSSYDFFPTILEYLGLEAAPADRKRPGMSYAPFVLGKTVREWRDRLYFEYAYVRSVRTRNLKYVERTKEWPSELYDLEADPSESRNVIDDPHYVPRLQTLREDLKQFFEGIGAPPIEDWKSTTKQELPVRNRATGKG